MDASIDRIFPSSVSIEMRHPMGNNSRHKPLTPRSRSLSELYSLLVVKGTEVIVTVYCMTVRVDYCATQKEPDPATCTSYDYTTWESLFTQATKDSYRLYE
jgi:hypothetical protein